MKKNEEEEEKSEELVKTMQFAHSFEWFICYDFDMICLKLILMRSELCRDILNAHDPSSLFGVVNSEFLKRWACNEQSCIAM